MHLIIYYADPIHEATSKPSTKYLAQEKETTSSTKAKGSSSFEMPDFTALGQEISAAFGKLFSKKK